MFQVALCGLSARDQRLLEIVINRPSFAKHAFKASDSQYVANPDIAIVDSASPQSLALLAGIRVNHPQTVAVLIEDADRPAGVQSRHWIPRQSLLVSIYGLLNQLADDELIGQPKHETGRAGGHLHAVPSTPAPAAAPAPAAQAKPDQAAFVAGQQAIPERLRALIVDDSLAVRQQLQAGLERLGFICTACDHAEAAQIALGSNSFHLALLDVVMPGMDGYELCRVIKRDRFMRKMPVVMLTSRASPFDRARGTLSGCDAYLTKPITWTEFSGAVDKVMMRAARNDREALRALGFTAA